MPQRTKQVRSAPDANRSQAHSNHSGGLSFPAVIPSRPLKSVELSAATAPVQGKLIDTLMGYIRLLGLSELQLNNLMAPERLEPLMSKIVKLQKKEELSEGAAIIAVFKMAAARRTKEKRKKIAKARAAKLAKKKAKKSAGTVSIGTATTAEYNGQVTETAATTLAAINDCIAGTKAGLNGLQVGNDFRLEFGSLGKNKTMFINDVVARMKRTYPESGATDVPYYHWFKKGTPYYTHFTVKKMGKRSSTDINFHLT